MCPSLPLDEESMDGEQIFGRGSTVPPERFNRRKPVQRTKARARRTRTNDMAKRGMHQRRNKKVAW